MPDTIEFTAVAMEGSSGGKIIGVVELGTWKKYNMNPDAKIKWAPAMQIIKIKLNFDCLIAGISVRIRTDPDRKAPVITNSHWRNDTLKNLSLLPCYYINIIMKLPVLSIKSTRECKLPKNNHTNKLERGDLGWNQPKKEHFVICIQT